MASRITSGARLCVRASIDKLVCNLTRSRHHNAVTASETAVGPRLDRSLPSYQVSVVAGGVEQRLALVLPDGTSVFRSIFFLFIKFSLFTRAPSLYCCCCCCIIFFFKFPLHPDAGQGPFNDSDGDESFFFTIGNGPVVAA